MTTQQTKLTNNNTFPLYLPTLCSSRTLRKKRLLSLSVVKLLSFVFSLDAVRCLLASSCKQALYWTRPDLNHRAKRLKFQVGAALLGLNKMLLNVIAQLGEDETGKYAGHTHPPSSGRWGMYGWCTGLHLLLKLNGKHSLTLYRQVGGLCQNVSFASLVCDSVYFSHSPWTPQRSPPLLERINTLTLKLSYYLMADLIIRLMKMHYYNKKQYEQNGMSSILLWYNF